MGAVTGYDIRVLEPAEYRAGHDLFMGSLHHAPAKDEQWELMLPTYEPGRTLGAFHGDTIVGCASTFAGALAVPGGAVLPMSMVSRVGVRADHTRRGVATRLMRTQLAGVAEPFASLRASEAGIYGRFGYGVATRGRAFTIERDKATIHPDVPAGGRVRLVDLDEAERLLPEIYRRIGPTRPGWLRRDGFWWKGLRAHVAWHTQPVMFAVHSGPDGDDGFACYGVTRDEATGRRRLELNDMMAGSAHAWAGLWRFLLSVDLVREIQAELRPLDEPLEQLLTDRRAVHTSAIADETWLRIVDVQQALAARSFGSADSIVIEVRDPLLPASARSASRPNSPWTGPRWRRSTSATSCRRHWPPPAT